MKHKISLFILTTVLLTSFVLAGCGTQPDSLPTDASIPKSTDTETALVTDPSSPTETEVPFVEPTPTEALAEVTNATISFASDVLPIIESRCVNCHGGREIEEGLLLRTYDEIMAGSDNGPVIIPGDTEGSLLVELITTKEMPKKGPKLTPPQIQTITDWVAAGAQNN